MVDRRGFGLAVQTKSARVLQDLDVLERIHSHSKCVVQMTLTTYGEDLCRILEPHVSAARERFEALKALRDRGIPTVVWLSPQNGPLMKLFTRTCREHGILYRPEEVFAYLREYEAHGEAPQLSLFEPMERTPRDRGG